MKCDNLEEFAQKMMSKLLHEHDVDWKFGFSLKFPITIH